MTTTEPMLARAAFVPLPLGAVRPRGWLERQLRIQLAGLTGNLDLFWPDVMDSAWIGGTAEGWERGPYWLDGALPLAYLMDDAALLARTRRWVDEILERQHDDGWLGPVHDEQYGYAYDPWPVFVVLKALRQYVEVEGDERAILAMLRFARRLEGLLADGHLRSWAHYRWADLVHTLHWLFERTGEGWLLGLCRTVREQGFDWHALARRFPFRARTRPEELDLRTHVVNQAMGVKSDAVWSRQADDPTLGNDALALLDALDRYHGQANGTFSGDEHLAGPEPYQGTELCAVVELMYSLEVMVAILGDPRLADRLELLAYNALPAAIAPDHWSHQYVQQVNQVACGVHEDRVYTSNGPDANVFGLEPHFGCCTANMHQGWPKLVTHLVMRRADGLVVCAYAPCTVLATLGGRGVRLDVDTAYPFREEVDFALDTEGEGPVPVTVRVPAWCAGATLTHPDGRVDRLAPGFHEIPMAPGAARPYRLRLPMTFRTVVRGQGGVAIYRGPLLYGLHIAESWRCIGGESPHQDWEVTPRSPWNYALLLDPSDPDAGLRIDERPLGDPPFSPEGVPLSARATGVRIRDWGLDRSAAGPLPDGSASNGAAEPITLIPYGASNLRIAEFPVVER